MEEFVIVRGVLKEYRGNAAEVVIPAGVRRIGKDAFHHYLCRGISKLTLPEGVTRIDDRAFQQLERLETVSLPSTLKKIGEGAFIACTSLREIHIPDGVTELGAEAFSNCEKLVAVHLPADLTRIPKALFRMCGSLACVNIPAGVDTIDPWAFSWCGELTEVQLPDGVASIGENAFYECRKLRKINISESCAVDPEAFTCCFSLADQYGLLILQNRLLVHYPGKNDMTLTVIPNSVEAIRDGAFASRYVCHLEMHIRCPLWESGERTGFGHTVALLSADSSTISFRDDNGRIIAKVILAVDGESGEGHTYGALSLRQKDHAFDFAWYDACWEKLRKTHNRLRVALTRLQYPYALSQKARKNYETVVGENGGEAGRLAIDWGEPELLSMLLAKNVLPKEVLPQLVDYANRAGDPTMTAMLLTALAR